jgi:hypothetical protein
VVGAGSSLLSDDLTYLWTDLSESAQAETASELASAVESSAFLRAKIDNRPRTVVISDQSNIG